MNIETIKINADNEQGFIIINKIDFDKTSQSVFDDAKKSAKKSAKKQNTK